MKVVLKDQNRVGLFPEHNRIGEIVISCNGMTKATKKRLEQARAIISQEGDTITIHFNPNNDMPDGIVAVSRFNICGTFLRLDNEPNWPNEYQISFWNQVDLTPCPKCKAPLIWYEAGYVPGYRVCGRKPHHHFIAKTGD